MAAGVVFFDVDGTLVPKMNSSDHVAKFLGHHAELAAAEVAYAAGTMTSRDWEREDAKGWAGQSAGTVKGCLDELPLVEGIPEVVAWCRDRDVVPILATLAWMPVGRYLCDRFGFAGCCGPQLAHRRGVFTGSVERHFDEYDKRQYAQEVAAGHGFALQECVAVGDGASDVPLFQEAGLGIAFNANPLLTAVADVSLEGEDLRLMLPALIAWFDRR